MFLNLFAFGIILKCVVLASCEEQKENQIKFVTWKKPIIESRQSESSIDEADDLSTSISDLQTSVSESEATSTTEQQHLITDNPTSNEDVNSTNVSESSSEAITISTEKDVNVTVSSTDPNETENSTNESTVDETENIITEAEVAETIATEATEVSLEPTLPEPTTLEPTTLEPTTLEPTTLEPTTLEPTTLEPTTLEPTTLEPTSPEPETTTIDPKYRNETFDLYLAEFMRTNPSAIMYTSPGFPTPYSANLNISFSDTLRDCNCTGIDVVIHYLDLNPFQPDTLNIRGGDEDATDEVGKKFTGREFNIVYKIIHKTSLFIWFNSGPLIEDYQGFVLTYSPFGDNTPTTTTTEAPITIPASEQQTFEVQLVVPKEKRTNVTWQQFKEVLSGSASQYIIDQKLHVEQAHPENVTFNVFSCPDNWPEMWNLDYDPEVDFDLTIFDYELSSNSLSEMWDTYGRNDFSDILGVNEYNIPDETYVLLLWTGISLSIITIFVGVLYGIWRIDVFREYRRMYNKNEYQDDIVKDKSEMDISMHPIPHQPYPTLFETNEMNSAGYYDSNEINSSSYQNNGFHNDIHQEQSTTPSSYRNTSNHFSPNIIDFNDSQLFPDDEEDFGRVPTLSPRSKQKLIVLGAKRDESIT